MKHHVTLLRKKIWQSVNKTINNSFVLLVFLIEKKTPKGKEQTVENFIVHHILFLTINFTVFYLARLFLCFLHPELHNSQIKPMTRLANA